MPARSLFLAFRTKPNIVDIFHIIGFKVGHTQRVQTDSSGNVSCDCVTFRMTGKSCKHCSFVKDKLTHKVVNETTWDPLTSTENLHLEVDQIGIIDFERRGAVGVLSEDIPDVSARELILGLAHGSAYPSSSYRINPERLKAELHHAMVNSVELIDASVQKIGEEVKKLDAKVAAPTAPLSEEEKAKHAVKVNRKAWRSYARPDPKEFYVSPDVWDAIVASLHNAQKVLLTGPSGSGKSELLAKAAKVMGLPFEAFNMGAMSEPRTSLIGATHFSKTEGTWFSESRFVRTVKSEKAVILLDELTRCPPSAYNILLPLLDRQGYLALDESEDAAVIKKGPYVAFCATANIGMEYTGTEAMDKAMNDRFDVVIDLFFPPTEAEHNILMNRTGVDSATAKKLVALAEKQRNMTKEGVFNSYISTRMLIATAQLVADGLSYHNGLKFAVLNHFSNDGDSASERNQILQIAQKLGV